MAKKVTEEYPELMHYTTGNGLAGIVSSGCLWATHASFLNDAEEITHFFDQSLPHIARDESRAWLNELRLTDPSARNTIERDGLENIVEAQASEVVAKLRSATLGLNTPFVVSLCGAEDERVGQAGLLSQWRGYGQDGGYAIVFDADGLDQILKEERANFHYQHMQWGNVFYAGNGIEEQPATQENQEAESAIRKFIQAGLRDSEPDGEASYNAITTLSCFSKHWGFSEEKEIRIVAIPTETEIARQVRSEGESPPEKPIKTFSRAGLLVPYIELFWDLARDPNFRLPIKRVLVGPHRDKELRKRSVTALLQSHGYDARVISSDIPYIGR